MLQAAKHEDSTGEIIEEGLVILSSYDIPNENIIGFDIETSGAWGPAAKRLMWTIAEAGGGPQDVVAQCYRCYAEEISAALHVALYSSHLRFLAVSVKDLAILTQAPAND